jgi:hypothetical protein
LGETGFIRHRAHSSSLEIDPVLLKKGYFYKPGNPRAAGMTHSSFFGRNTNKSSPMFKRDANNVPQLRMDTITNPSKSFNRYRLQKLAQNQTLAIRQSQDELSPGFPTTARSQSILSGRNLTNAKSNKLITSLHTACISWANKSKVTPSNFLLKKIRSQNFEREHQTKKGRLDAEDGESCYF